MINIQLPPFSLELKEFNDLRTYKNHNKPGLYFIYNKNQELLYIGLSVSVISRLGNHIGSAKTNPFLRLRHNFKYFSVLECGCPVERDIYETHAINMYQPPYNLAKTFTYEPNRPIIKTKKEIEDELRREREHANSMANFVL